MATLETIRPNATVAAGSWTAVGAGGLHLATDETTPNGDTDYALLEQIGSGTTQSTMELGLGNPAEWDPNALRVRDAESWKTPTELSVRDADSWKGPKSLRVRNGEAWVTVIPEVVVSVTARREIGGDATAGYVIQVKAGTTVIAQSGSVTPGDTYGTATLTVPFNACLGVDPDDLRVAIVGTVTGNEELAFAELHVTQIEVDLND